MSATATLDVALAGAAKAIQTSKPDQAGKGEQFLNTLGDRALAVSGSEAAMMIQDFAGSTAFNVVKKQVSNFAENSELLLRLLDDAAKLHPFILIAVDAFKGAITLELDRRANDQKLTTLHVTMCDMMEVMALMKDLATSKHEGEGGVTIQQRLQGRILSITESINDCSKLCFSYKRRHLVVKYFTSFRWKTRFGDIADQFEKHKGGLLEDLQLYTSITAARTHELLTSEASNMRSLVYLAFERMQTPEERDLAAFAQRNGKDDHILEDGELVKQFLEKEKEISAKYDKGPTFGKDGAPTRSGLTPAELKEEIRKEVDTVLTEDMKAFERKLGTIEVRLKELNVTVRHESDRVISGVLAGMQAGPHERIKDKDLYHIWTEMGWKGSVKATHFVIALHEHFTAKASQKITANTNSAGVPAKTVKRTDTDATLSPDTSAQDSWALQYINVRHIQPLIEAIDDDGSSFVTVNELNDFTSRRPKGWSLPRWIAYWTIGFEMTTNWYWQRIQKNLFLILVAYREILPANRASFCLYSSWTFESILSGLRGSTQWDVTDWDHDKVFSRFKDYVVDEEGKLKTTLRRLAYNIDEDDTLLIMGGGRPEKYIMPLLCLLLERVLWTMDTAKTSMVSPNEFSMLDDSIGMVISRMRDRCFGLQAIYQLQNSNKKEKLERTFFGLYSYMFELDEKSEFWTRSWDVCTWLLFPADPDLGELKIPEPPLCHQVEQEELDLFMESSGHTESEATNESEHNPDARASLVGAWSGSYEYQEKDRQIDGLVSLSITEHDGGKFEGSGVDGIGPFTVDGTIVGNKVIFKKSYTIRHEVWKYIGSLDTEMTKIVGRWGPREMEDDVAPVSAVEGSGHFNHPGERVDGGGIEDRESSEQAPPCDIEITVEGPSGTPGKEHDDGISEAGSALSSTRTDATEVLVTKGTFSLVRRPVDYFLYRPSDAEFQESRPKALWKMVSNWARQSYRSHHLVWDTLRERRDQRIRFSALLLKQEESGALYDSDEFAEWAKIIQQSHPNDVRMWRAITHYKEKRAFAHTASCDKCKEPIRNSRLVCSDCTMGGWSNSIDLCAHCWRCDYSRESDNKRHIPTHMLIQFRHPISRLELYEVFEKAKGVVGVSVENMSTVSGLSCTQCEKAIPEKPYWCCLACNDVYICISCNSDNEAKKSWLLQHVAGNRDNEVKKSWLLRLVAARDAPHSELHALALANNSSVSSETELTIEHRLDRLEKKFEEQAVASRELYGAFRELHDRFVNHEKVMQERMEEGFRLLHQGSSSSPG